MPTLSAADCACGQKTARCPQVCHPPARAGRGSTNRERRSKAARGAGSCLQGRPQAKPGATPRAAQADGGGCDGAAGTERKRNVAHASHESRPLIDSAALFWRVVPQEGLEPPRPCEHQILSLTRLPVPPLGPRSSVGERPRIIATAPAASNAMWVPATVRDAGVASAPLGLRALRVALLPRRPLLRCATGAAH